MTRNKEIYNGTNAVIPGGSRGMGRATACEFAARGGSVLIIARNKKDLASAEKEIAACRADSSQWVESAMCDATDMKALKKIIDDHIARRGVPHYLFNFVGYAYPNYIQNMTLDDFRKNMDVNYYGQLVPILAILPHFMRERRGHIVTCASVVAYLGLMGYATYAPTKGAICCLTESLRHELHPYGIRFSILYPPDTDTPGFENENKTKPAEVAIISESGGLLKPEEVAKKLLDDVAKKRFYILPGQAQFLWTVARHFPNLTHWIMDGELKKAAKKAAARSAT